MNDARMMTQSGIVIKVMDGGMDGGWMMMDEGVDGWRMDGWMDEGVDGGMDGGTDSTERQQPERDCGNNSRST